MVRISITSIEFIYDLGINEIGLTDGEEGNLDLYIYGVFILWLNPQIFDISRYMMKVTLKKVLEAGLSQAYFYDGKIALARYDP